MATAKRTAKKKVVETDVVVAVSAEERTRMIAEQAYLLAAARGFTPGGEVGDWLAAEQMIAARLEAAR